MDDSFSDIIIYQLKKMLPLLCTILFVLLAYVPISDPFSKVFKADISMICIYFWALYRRDLLGPISVFILGVVVDSLAAVPLGINVFVLMLIYVLAITYGSFVNTKPFIISWIGFAIISAIGFFVKWLILSVYYSMFLPILSVFISYIATFLLYPIIARCNIFIQNKLLANEEVIYE